jgi:hypothetical protein
MLMAMILFLGIKVAAISHCKVCAGYFMQPAVECCVSAVKFLDNSIQKQNPLRCLCGDPLLHPFPVVEAEPQKLEGNDFMPGFRGLILLMRALKRGASWKA